MTSFTNDSACTACSLHSCGIQQVGMRTVRDPQSLPPNPGTPIVLCVGSWPSYVEDNSNAPFTGPSGKTLKDIFLGNSQIPKLASVYLTNILRCYPKGLKNFSPTEAMLTACYPHLEQDLKDLETLNPSKKVILLLGGPAAKGVMQQSVDDLIRKNSGILNHKGWTVFATYNPAILTINPSADRGMAEHFRITEDYLQGIIVKPSEPNIVQVREPNP